MREFFTQKSIAIAAIFTLLWCSGTSPNVHATLDQTLPEPLIKSGKLPPENADGPYQNWKDRNKYFLVVGVNETGLPDTDLPFTQADATEITKALTELGYQPLVTDSPILTGKEATRSAIIKAVKTSHQGKYEQDIIAIYVTGHASVGTKDLWLQTYGQEELGEGQGIALSELVTRTRFKEGQAAFEGELVIIVDTCFSGQGALTQSLTLGELGRHTTIFSASTSKQESYPLNAPDLPKMSAFTYSLLQAMGAQWGKADWDGDGMLRYAEMQIFSKNLLRELWKANKVEALMEPELFNANQEQFLAYRRDQVRALNTPYRIALQTEEVNKALATHLQTLGANPKEKPELPKEAKTLAKGLDAKPDDFYTQAIQATAEGRLESARALFAKADQQSRDREQAEQNKRYNLYLARARMESYDGKFTEAFVWYQQSAEIKPPTSSDLLNEMGLAGLRAGKFSEAELYLQQALQQREQSLDPNDPDLAVSLDSLAELFAYQAKYPEVLPLLQRALQIREASLSATHPDMAASLNNLAWEYFRQENYAEAEPLFQRALQIQEASLGEDHPDVAQTIHNLARLYDDQGHEDQAERYLQRAIQIQELALSATHPDLGNTLSSLAILYQTQKKYDKSEALHQRIITISETALGSTHPETATAFTNLGSLFLEQEKYRQAEPLFKRALQIDEVAYGPYHDAVGVDLLNLGSLYLLTKQHVKAEPLYLRAIDIFKTKLGPTHPTTRLALKSYNALLYEKDLAKFRQGH